MRLGLIICKINRYLYKEFEGQLLQIINKDQKIVQSVKDNREEESSS